jgi:uncharacterized protein YutE (UPF0331/DUF86 family)
MINPETLASLIDNLQRYLKKLSILAARDRETFLADFTNVESAKYLLQISIEVCIDVGHHIVADEGYRVPANYRDTFVILHEHDIIPESFLPTLHQMVSFRNRVVHLYWEVDDATVYQILQENLADFETYVGYILQFVQDSKPE